VGVGRPFVEGTAVGIGSRFENSCLHTWFINFMRWPASWRVEGVGQGVGVGRPFVEGQRLSCVQYHYRDRDSIQEISTIFKLRLEKGSQWERRQAVPNGLEK